MDAKTNKITRRTSGFFLSKIVLPWSGSPGQGRLVVHYSNGVPLLLERERRLPGCESRRGQNVVAPRKGQDVDAHRGVGGGDIGPTHERPGEDTENPTRGILLALTHLIGNCLRAVGPPEEDVGQGVRRLGTGIRGGLERNSGEHYDCENDCEQLGHDEPSFRNKIPKTGKK